MGKISIFVQNCSISDRVAARVTQCSILDDKILILDWNFGPPTLLRPKLYFDLKLTSTFLAKLYFDQNCTSTCTYRPIRSPDLTKKSRSTEKVELMRTLRFSLKYWWNPNIFNTKILLTCCNYIFHQKLVSFLTASLRNFFISFLTEKYVC